VSAPRIDRVLETGIYVKDLKRARRFYESVLGLELVSEEKGRHVFLKAGKSMLLLFRAERTLEESKLPPHGAAGSQHFALQVREEDFDSWKVRLKEKGVEVEKEFNWGVSRSLYFRDPDGNLVELITPGNWPVEG
jgi:catechol-2,3-dioxygenase